MQQIFTYKMWHDPMHNAVKMKFFGGFLYPEKNQNILLNWKKSQQKKEKALHEITETLI